MAITVEDGTGLSNADSYLSVANADTYHTNFGNSAWTGTTAVKEAALRKATQYLDSTYMWKGDISSTTQSLNFPRINIEDSQGRILDDTIPIKLKDATAELALAALSSDLVGITTNSNYVTYEKVGDLEVKYASGSPTGREYNKVNAILADLYDSIIGGMSIKLARV